MRSLSINPSFLRGSVAAPPSKSHTLRALLFAMKADTKSNIYHYLESPDTRAMAKALTLLGSKVVFFPDRISVTPGFAPALDVIDVGNSGQVLRFIGALAGLLPSYTVLTGDLSIRSRRPVQPLLEGLQGLGGLASSLRLDGSAPIVIKGPIVSGKTTLSGEDSQPVSGLLIASSFLPGITEIHVRNPGERPWIALTLSWLDRLGIGYENHNYTHYKIFGHASYAGFDFSVPGDFSSAAFPLVAALITGSQVTISHLDMSDVQGDKQIVEILSRMGASLEVVDSSLKVHQGKQLSGTTIDVNGCIDAIPILAVVGCFAQGVTKLTNGGIARKKESDRILAIAQELRKMGAHIEEEEEGLTIYHSPLKGARVHSHCDHRIAMALAVAALGAQGETSLSDTECIEKSYPHFVREFQKLGAHIEEV